MSRIGQAGRRWMCGVAIAAAPAICSAQTAGTGGGAKISAPVVSGVSDPFVNAAPANSVAPIPTPIMTSSGHVAEASAALKPPATGKPPVADELQPIAPQSMTAAPTNVIDAGKLVPLSTPAASSPSPSHPVPAKPQAVREPTPEDKLTEAAPAALKPIQPAVISRETVTAPTATAAAKTKPVVAKKPAAKPKPAETPNERIAPAVNFSFPQPVIPLESAVRKFLQRTLSRR